MLYDQNRLVHAGGQNPQSIPAGESQTSRNELGEVGVIVFDRFLIWWLMAGGSISLLLSVCGTWLFD